MPDTISSSTLPSSPPGAFVPLHFFNPAFKPKPPVQTSSTASRQRAAAPAKAPLRRPVALTAWNEDVRPRRHPASRADSFLVQGESASRDRGMHPSIGDRGSNAMAAKQGIEIGHTVLQPVSGNATEVSTPDLPSPTGRYGMGFAGSEASLSSSGYGTGSRTGSMSAGSDLDNDSCPPSPSEGPECTVSVPAIDITGASAAQSMRRVDVALEPQPRAPAVRIAVGALVAECVISNTAAPAARTAAAPDAPQPASASELFHLGDKVYKAIFDQKASNWSEGAARAIAQAAAGLARDASEEDIEVAFVEQALGEAIDWGSADADDGGQTTAGDHRPKVSLREWISLLDRIGQLRFKENAQRQALDAALNRELTQHATPKVRRIAQHVVNVMAEMAAEQVVRHIDGGSIESLLASCREGDMAGIHSAFTSLYQIDRAVGKPYQSGVDRWLSAIKRLPIDTQRSFVDMLAPDSQDPAQQLPAQNLRACLKAQGNSESASNVSHRPGISLNRPPPALQRDQEDFMSDMFTAAGILRGKAFDAGHATAPSAARTVGSLRNMRPTTAKRNTLRSVLRWINVHFNPFTYFSSLESARRQISSAIETQAAGKSVTVTQWLALKKAMSDLDRIPGHRANYAGIVDACIAQLEPAQCAALHKLLGHPGQTGMDRTIARHLTALDAALTKELPVWTTAVSIRDAMASLYGKQVTPELVDALERLSESFKAYAGDSTEALKLCQLALQRLPLQSREIQKALTRIGTLAAQSAIKRNIKSVLCEHIPADQADSETIRLASALQVLATSLEHAVGR